MELTSASPGWAPRPRPTFYLDDNDNMAWEYPGDIFGNYGIATDEILLGRWAPKELTF